MKYRAIVLEDDEACRLYLSTILESRGYETLTFSEPLACPLYTNRNCCCTNQESCGDFLLTDNQMPKMTGLEFVELQMERGCRGATARKAIFSANFTPQELEKAEELGCKIFRKPYRAADISAWLDEQEENISPERKLLPLAAQS